MKSIRLAILGIGNAACTLLQGIKYYSEDDNRAGLWHRRIGGYRVDQIKVVGAFDVDDRKVGLRISEAAFKEPNNAERHVPIDEFDIVVDQGEVLDPPVSALRNHVKSSSGEFADRLKSLEPDVVLCTLSSGMVKSAVNYARITARLRMNFINATPSMVVRDRRVASRFVDSVVVGDDLMSQLGGTVLHRELVAMMSDRGISIDRSYQLDVGGGSDTLNTMDEQVKPMKQRTKSDVIRREAKKPIDVVAGTSDYVDFLGNNRVTYFWLEGTGFLNSITKMDVYLRSQDGPNAGNILLDTIRAVKSARDRGIRGVESVICSYGFKSHLAKGSVRDAVYRFAARYVG